MKSLRKITGTVQADSGTVSVRALAQSVLLVAPLHVSSIVAALLAPVRFHSIIVTPSGTALGGTVDVTLSSDGTYTFQVHMHDSGFDPYDFRVRCAVQTAAGVTLLFQVSGHTDGTGSAILGSPKRDFDHTETKKNPLIQEYWLDMRKASVSVAKSYSDVGLLNTLEDIGKGLLGFAVAYVTVGAGLALVVCASAEIANAAGAEFVGPGGLVGVAVAAGVVWLFGAAAIVPAIVAGVAAGAVTDALVKHRTLTDDEYHFAAIVFGDTLPPQNRIYVTNLSTSSGRQFTWPNVDGSILLNLGAAYDDPMHYRNDTNYPVAGQVYIHEMTHAWQYKTRNFTAGILCKYALNTRSYRYGPAGTAWDDFGVEQEAALVDAWYSRHAGSWKTPTELATNLSSQDAIKDAYFPYIANNIRLGQN